jgi:hypothetical protein
MEEGLIIQLQLTGLEVAPAFLCAEGLASCAWVGILWCKGFALE